MINCAEMLTAMEPMTPDLKTEMQPLLEGAARLGIVLTERQVEMFSKYQAALLHRPGSVGLTAVREASQVQRRHFVESLALGSALARRGLLRGHVIDIGSGAGFPGVPLLTVWPELSVTLLEATGRKARFLTYLRELLALDTLEVISGRAEELGHEAGYREQYDLALARSLAPLPVLLELALPFLRVGGYLASPKGSRLPFEVEDAQHALEKLGAVIEDIEPLDVVEPVPHLLLVRKTSETPLEFSRRAGIPAKRPLR